jgi:hypothetical protein
MADLTFGYPAGRPGNNAARSLSYRVHLGIDLARGDFNAVVLCKYKAAACSMQRGWKHEPNYQVSLIVQAPPSPGSAKFRRDLSCRLVLWCYQRER